MPTLVRAAGAVLLLALVSLVAVVSLSKSRAAPPTARRSAIGFDRCGANPQVFIGKRGVAVGMGSGLHAVDPDGAVHENAVELDEDPPPGGRFRKGEGPAIPSRPGIDKSPRSSGRGIAGDFPQDAPIMRKEDFLPGRIVLAGQSPGGIVAEFKFPIIAQRNDLPRADDRLY